MEGEGWEEKGDRHGGSLSGDRGIGELSPHELQPIGENRSHNLATSCAQQTTTSKLVRQNASGIHQNAPLRE